MRVVGSVLWFYWLVVTSLRCLCGLGWLVYVVC